jgi:hypothetical protein
MGKKLKKKQKKTKKKKKEKKRGRGVLHNISENTRKRGSKPQLPVVHKRTRGNPFEVTSLPVALLVIRNDTFCTNTIVVVQNVP